MAAPYSDEYSYLNDIMQYSPSSTSDFNSNYGLDFLGYPVESSPLNLDYTSYLGDPFASDLYPGTSWSLNDFLSYPSAPYSEDYAYLSDLTSPFLGLTTTGPDTLAVMDQGYLQNMGMPAGSTIDYSRGVNGEDMAIVRDANGTPVGYIDNTGQLTQYSDIAKANEAAQKPGVLERLAKSVADRVTASRAAGGTGATAARAAGNPADTAAKALELAATLYKAATGSKGLNPNDVKRASTVRDLGPEYQAARPAKTLYASGGLVDLPERVSGGLLPITHQLAKRLIAKLGGGQDDVVDIKAAPGEYVLDAEVVSALGDGNTVEGAKKLDQMRYNIRKHKRTGGLSSIPPKAKSIEQYLKG